MFALAPSEALTLSRLAEEAGAPAVARAFSRDLPEGTQPADPSPRGLVLLAGFLIDGGERAAGTEYLRRAALHAPADPFMGESVGRIASGIGERTLAEEASTPARALQRRATALHELDEAALREASRRWLGELGDGAARAFVLVELARAWHRLDRLDVAVELARRAVAGDQDYPRARTTLSRIEAERGCHGAAARVLPSTDEPTVAIERSVLLTRAGTAAAAREVLRRAVARHQDAWTPELLWNAAQAHRLLDVEPGSLADRLAEICRQDPDAPMRILENVCQATGGDHRSVNIKDGLQRLLRRGTGRSLQPETYILPEERLAAEARLIRSPEEVWILKPARMFGGKGARLVSGATGGSLDVSGVWVLQRYVDAPRLVDGHKAHVRCYLLSVPGSPRALFVSLDGIVRLAPRPWDDGAGGAVERHITNTNLHWQTGELRIEEDAGRETSGHVRRLSAVLEALGRESGVEHRTALRRFSGDVAAAVFGELQSPLVGLVALDLMLDVDDRFHLLEIESRPQFVAGGVPVVGRIHRTLGQEAWPILSAHLQGTDLPASSGSWVRL